ncbi:MAG TPA: NADH-quinone oxidoreductase subunit N [Vicinamibacterales bacterium]|nr:NADH-quinone oxidoreductase subunit N [Vicinamibacterales bacterium]
MTRFYYLTPGMPLVPELALFALAVLVLIVGIVRQGNSGRIVGWVTFVGLIGVFGLTCLAEEGRSLLQGTFVQDALAIFSKRLFVASAIVSLLGSLTLQHKTFNRRAGEYHFALLVSLLGMFVLVSARDLVLLFVAFELMSIPLYMLTGFLKRDPAAPEAALKFFLIGTVSSAAIAYGMSFVYGVTGGTTLDLIPRAIESGQPLMLLGMAILLAGLGFKIAAFPFHMWAPDTYEAATTPFIAWLSVAPKAAGFVAIIRLYIEGMEGAAGIWMPVLATLAGMTIVTGNLMAIPQRNIKRLLAYSGVAHIGYMLIGLAAFSSAGIATVLFYLVAYLFGNMGAFMVVETVARSEQSDGIDAYRGLAQRSPLLALAMLVFLLSLGGIPFVAGFWAKLYIFLAAAERGMYGLVFLGALLTVVALYYYLLVARRMYIDAPTRREPVPVSGLIGTAIAVCVLGVVGVGIYPGPWVTVAQRVASTLFP